MACCQRVGKTFSAVSRASLKATSPSGFSLSIHFNKLPVLNFPSSKKRSFNSELIKSSNLSLSMSPVVTAVSRKSEIATFKSRKIRKVINSPPNCKCPEEPNNLGVSF